MKKFLKIIGPILLTFLLAFSTVEAGTIFTVGQGGTGTNTITGIIQGNGASAFTPITVGTGLSFTGGTLSATNAGTVTSVSGTTNRITSTGGSTPVIDVSSVFEALLGKVANPLSQFASTTSLQLAGVISDETGSGPLVFSTSPSFTTPSLGAATASGLTLSGITGSTQCLSVNTSGVVSGTGTACGSGSAGVSTIASADGSITVTGTTAIDLSVVKAPKLTTARTIGILTGDATSAGSTFDGTANNTNALTLATVNANTGSWGSATASPTFTVNGKGLITAASNTTITPAIGSITGLGSGIATWLATPSSANLLSAVTGSTGTGALVFGTSPTISLASASTGVTQSPFDNSTKLATTAYVDSANNALDSKPSVAYASTSALPANTYNNGTSGVGATLTGNANGPLIIDSVTILVGQVGERVLVAGEAAPANNGWYTITQQGIVAVSPYILTRATESDQGAEIGSGYLTSVIAPNSVTPGTSNNGKAFISVAGADPFVVGTTSLTFSQVGSTYSAGNGLGLSGSTFSIDTAITVDKTTAQTLTNKTLTSPVINGTLSGTVVVPVANGGTGTGTAFTLGSAVFAGASGTYAQDNANFFWDATNHRLGIGTTLPRTNLDVTNGTANVDGNTSNALNLTAANVALNSSNTNLSVNTNDAQAADVGGSIGLGALYRGSDRGSLNYAIIKSGKTNSTDSNYSGYLSFGTRNNGSQVAEAMRIDNLGNVGIGTTAPDVRFQVGDYAEQNTLKVTGLSTANMAPVISLYRSGAREYVIAGVGNNMYFANTGGLANYNDTTIAAAANMTIGNSGNVGIGTTSPTATLHLKAGTATASTAPLKFTSGTNLTTTEAGAIEYDGSHLYFTATNGGTRFQLDQQSGAISSVSNSDGTLTISPTTGAVVASLALGHANTWTGVQTFNPSVTAAAGLAKGEITTGTLTAIANNDTLIGLDIAPTFTNGAFTGVENASIRSAGDIIPSATSTWQLGTASLEWNKVFTRSLVVTFLAGNSGSDVNLTTGDSTHDFVFALNSTSTNIAKYMHSTGDVLYQNGGSFTDDTIHRVQVGGGLLYGGTAVSAAAWGVAGVNMNSAAATYTDSSTASGTVTNNMVNTFGIPTLAATSASITYTNAATLYIAGAPVAGTNATLTNKYSLDVAGGATLLGGTLAVTGHVTLEGVTSTGATGTGNLVFDTSPTLITPNLGTPSALVGTNITGTGASFTAGQATAALGLKSATTTVSVSSATAPTTGQVLTATSGTAATWQSPSAGAPTMSINTVFESSTRFNTSFTGGTVTFVTSGVTIDTTSTASRVAQLSMSVYGGGLAVFNEWSGSPTFSYSGSFSVLGAGCSTYIGIGPITATTSGHTFTNAHVGFKIVGTTLSATQADGTTENSTTLATVAAGDGLDLIVKINGTASATYYYRQNGGALSAGTTLTGNIPTGDTSGTLFQVSASNNGNAARVLMSSTSVSYQR